MRKRGNQPSNGTSRTNRRQLRETGGMLAGAAAVLGGAPRALAHDDATSTLSARSNVMPAWKPDPTFYPSPRSAMQAPAETLAYVVRVNPTGDGRPDAITVVDVDPISGSYGTIVGEVEMTNAGDEMRRTWVNLDLVWVGALAIAGGIALVLGLGPLLAP